MVVQTRFGGEEKPKNLKYIPDPAAAHLPTSRWQCVITAGHTKDHKDLSLLLTEKSSPPACQITRARTKFHVAPEETLTALKMFCFVLFVAEAFRPRSTLTCNAVLLHVCFRWCSVFVIQLHWWKWINVFSKLDPVWDFGTNPTGLGSGAVEGPCGAKTGLHQRG